jgi:hypothetical protein
MDFVIGTQTLSGLAFAQATDNPVHQGALVLHSDPAIGLPHGKAESAQTASECEVLPVRIGQQAAFLQAEPPFGIQQGGGSLHGNHLCHKHRV